MDQTENRNRKPAGANVTVIIPTLNAGKNISDLLDSLHGQDRPADEIIVVDSASSDDTQQICRDDPKVRLMSIPRTGFDHGGTRDMALKESTGDIIVFMAQDALPADEHFLDKLTAPLASDDIAVSTGRQTAKSDASPAEKLVREYNYPAESFVRSQKDLTDMGIKTFFVSNVCAAYRKDIYTKLGGFESPLKTNEDMLFAAKAIRSGYKIAYVSDAVVYHSHDLTWREQYERNRLQGYEISRHDELVGDVSLEAEGKKMVLYVSKRLLKKGKIISMAGFAIDCAARYLGSRKGRKTGNDRRQQ